MICPYGDANHRQRLPTPLQLPLDSSEPLRLVREDGAAVLGFLGVMFAALFQERTMSQEVLLTLHCPQCKQITDVVTEGENLICLDCGWRFDEKTAARFLGRERATDKA